uniref:Globin b n=1 Tax=Glossoscolex paulistus TaxID=1046353 RepID=A0A0P4VJP8_9ANNE
MGDVVKAGAPGVLVPAASKLRRKDMQEGSLEGIEVVVWDVSSFVLLLQVVQLSLEGVRLVKGADGDVKASEDTEGVCLELRGSGVMTVDSLEEGAGIRNLGKERSPYGLSEVLSVVSMAVCPSPLGLHLQSGQDVTLRCHGNGHQGEQHNQGLHFQDGFQPQGYNLL